MEVEGGQAEAHLPNSGRLRELLVPGVRVRLAHRGHPGRRTPYDLVLVEIPEGEQGPREPDGSDAAAAVAGDPDFDPGAAGDREADRTVAGGPWACLDTRLPPRVLAAALARGGIPPLAGHRLVASEPALGEGRADLLLKAPDGVPVVVEAKSITLVRAGAGLFPDSPTVRGAGHARALAAERDRRALLAFVVQRGDARSVRANQPADPDFAAALRAARRAGVGVVAGRCRVSPAGLTWAGELPLERYRRGAPVDSLPDHLAPGLRLLVCGLNPGHYSAWYGMYFARPGNRFWPAMRSAGLVPPTAGPGDEAWLARTHRIGFTDVVKRPTGGIADLDAAEWEAGATRMRRLLRRWRPGAVCFVGLRGARAALGRDTRPGPQPRPLEGVPAFALPSTSPRQAAYGPVALTALFRELAAWLEGPEGR